MKHQMETERLILKPSTINDLEKCLEMDLDPEVTKYIPGVWDGSDTHMSFLSNSILGSYGKGLGYWSIFLKNNPLVFIGWILLAPYNKDTLEIEIGWRLKRSSWDKGYATEAAYVITKYAFKTIGLENIYAYIDFGNYRSIKVAKKLGFKYLSDFIYDGIHCDAYRMTYHDFFSK